jgi:hypothetical protein
MRIRNTLALHEVEISEACLGNGPPVNPLTELTGPREFAFDGDGNLPPF